MAKKDKSFADKEVILTFSTDDYETLVKIIQDAGNVFKTVEDYLMFIAQNRIDKEKGGTRWQTNSQ